MAEIDHELVCDVQVDSGRTVRVDWEATGDDELGRGLRMLVTAPAGGFVGRLHLRLRLPETREPYFMLPGLFYETGRRLDRPSYAKLGPLDLPEFTAPQWTFAVDRLAYPVAMAHVKGEWYAIEAGPHYRIFDQRGQAVDGWRDEIWGDTEPQVGFGVAWDGEVAELSCLIPASEGPRRLVRNRYDHAVRRTLTLPAGYTLALDVRVARYAGERHTYWRMLRASYERLALEHRAATPLPVDLAARTACHGIKAWHWVDDPGYTVYTAAFDRSAEFNANHRERSLGWHFEALGFVGGFFVAYALLWYGQTRGDAKAIDMAMRLIRRWCAEATTEWGLFRTSFHPGPAKTPNGLFNNPAAVGPANPDPTGATPFYGSCWFGQKHLHARTTADSSLYLARCLALLPADDPEVVGHRAVLRRSLEAVLGVQQPDGRFGQVYDIDERSICQDVGAGGVLWIAALHEAIGLFADDAAFVGRLRAEIARAGDGYAGDLDEAWLVGAPEDTSVAPNSESGDCFMLAYEAVHRLEPTAVNLDRFRRSADWALTWRRAFNGRFHPRSVLGAFDFRTFGADLASSQNNQVHIWGLHSLGSLVNLSRLTGDAHYARRALDHWAFAGQMLCTVAGQWNGQRGMCSEQFYCCDWSIWDNWDPTVYHEQKGTLMGSSHLWCVAFFILGAEQLGAG